jgi:nitroreductase
MNVLEAIKGRRSIRKYSSRAVEEEKLASVLEAARLAPSASNAQEWRFIVVKDKEKLAGLMDAADGQGCIGEAPAAIVACGLKHKIMACGQPTDTVDLSIAMSFIVLEAYEQGLGTCWLGRFYEDKVKKVLGIPENVSVVAVTPIGYPAEEPAPRPRKETGEIVGYDKF